MRISCNCGGHAANQDGWLSWTHNRPSVIRKIGNPGCRRHSVRSLPVQTQIQVCRISQLIMTTEPLTVVVPPEETSAAALPSALS